MKNARRILITTESHEVFIVRFTGESDVRGFCPDCAAETQMLTFDESVIVLGESARRLIRHIESNAVHSIETASGHLLICAESLPNPIRETP